MRTSTREPDREDLIEAPQTSQNDETPETLAWQDEQTLNRSRDAPVVGDAAAWLPQTSQNLLSEAKAVPHSVQVVVIAATTRREPTEHRVALPSLAPQPTATAMPHLSQNAEPRVRGAPQWSQKESPSAARSGAGSAPSRMAR